MNAVRRAAMVVVHLALAVLSNYSAFLLRFDGDIPWPQAPLFGAMLPCLLAVRGATLVPFRLYEGFWRYTSIWDLRNMVIGVATSTAIFYLIVHHAFGLTAYSRSIFIIDSTLLICLMGGVRVAQRVCREFRRPAGARRVLIYGAGDAGEMIVREMIHARELAYEPVGFVDDNPAKSGQHIHGVPVLGTRADLPHIVAEKQPQEILIAIPTVEAATIRLILNALEPHQIRITTLPTLAQILDGEARRGAGPRGPARDATMTSGMQGSPRVSKVTVSQIRELSPEDVLTRAAIRLDPTAIREFIVGKRVMVTGAGGSIGSELCRQMAMLQPAALVLFERYENNLFALANDLADSGHAARLAPMIGDVADAARVEAVLREHRPEIIFHAAAHKHVPLMEQNPCEAIKNNVFGTRLLADAAERFGVERFILISSDKAVNPSSVMGATKRVAELLMQAKAASDTAFLTVRFGNVLASNGSVVPRFLQQIRAGGPVTVTHPDMRRYFILISEAVQLVLHAAARGSRGATYVLEMGDQIKLVDLARSLIRLSGLRPHQDIRITFIGLRPGEKLFEELVSADETVVASGVDKILMVNHRTAPAQHQLLKDILRLERLAVEGRSADALTQLRTILPEFQQYASPPVAPAAEELAANVRPRALGRNTGGQVTTGTAIRPLVSPAAGVRI